jgi:hypothetical protein
VITIPARSSAVRWRAPTIRLWAPRRLRSLRNCKFSIAHEQFIALSASIGKPYGAPVPGPRTKVVRDLSICIEPSRGLERRAGIGSTDSLGPVRCRRTGATGQKRNYTSLKSLPASGRPRSAVI